MKKTGKNQDKTVTHSGLNTAELLAMLAQKEAQLEAACQQRDAAIAERDKYKTLTDDLLRLAKIKRFAASSEKHVAQINLFDEAELEAAIDDLKAQVPAEKTSPKTASASPRKKTRNRGFSATLNRIRRELRLSDEEKAGASKTFFSKVKEELEYIPAQLNVIEIWQEKAVFETEYDIERMVAATRPVHPLGKCIATTSLLAHIITSKYADGLPLYRLNNMLARLGHEIGRNTMANWVIRLDEVFQPLITLARQHQNQGNYLQADETRIQVINEAGKSVQSDKWMWVTRGGPPDKPTVLFEYDPSRAGEVPARLLNGFKGVLQVDGYAGYAKVCREEKLPRIGGMDHARRKFIEASRAAKPSAKKRKKGPPSKADVAIGYIRKLYVIENNIADLSAEEKYQARQTLALPILKTLKSWLEHNLSRVLKDSLTHKAISYMLNQWDELIGYCNYGYVNISNALAENAIRPFAVGRRNWLFADSARGAKASATCYSPIETAKANGIEPSSYIKYVLENIAQATTAETLEALLPWNMPKSA
ncbi:IS66 family transposase [Gayadomonas joobiniege]|uniref:IS66 family transposase n=1 Tax=Gayadomonas joobiniege TaxID=1234606 RepID=UPI0003621BE6|nr:IS66 family transposase [Gayadomonas joobiniege]